MVNIDTTIYDEGVDHSIEMETVVNSTDMATLKALLANAGRIGTVNSSMTKKAHYDTTTDNSNTVAFTINNPPTGVPSSVTLYIESYSIEIISPTPTYRVTIRGYSE